MMNSVMLCEGSTDFTLLEYYMQKLHHWLDRNQNRGRGAIRIADQRSRTFFRGEDKLTIAATGGCSKIPFGLHTVLERNYLSAPGSSDVFQRIVIVTDRDEETTESEILGCLQTELDVYSVRAEQPIQNNVWISCEMESQMGLTVAFSLLILVIPFEQTGAMETFLLDSIAADDAYDAVIIEKCRQFVDSADPEKKYLNKRRYITKAKFDAYFSVRTAAEQFAERQNILRNVPWENYPSIQSAFTLLGDI